MISLRFALKNEQSYYIYFDLFKSVGMYLV